MLLTAFQSLPDELIFHGSSRLGLSSSPRMGTVTGNPAEKLKGVSFFQDLGPEALDLVSERMIFRTFPAGKILFRKGEQARGIYVLVGGRIEIFRSTADGREQVLHTETPIQSVAELPVFDGGCYPASARTAEDSDVLFLSIDTEKDSQRLCTTLPSPNDAIVPRHTDRNPDKTGKVFSDYPLYQYVSTA